MHDITLAEDAGFIRAIRESAGDDTARLVYADWLEEHGAPERAEFIRVQCWLAAAQPNHPEWDSYRLKERTLLEANRDRWWAPFAGILYRESAWYDRGFLSFMGVYRPTEFVTWHALLSDMTPTSRLLVGWSLPGDVSPLSQCPGLANLTELWTNDEGATFPPEDFGTLIRSPFAQNLVRLELGSSWWFERLDCQLLSAEPVLPQLQQLRLALVYPTVVHEVIRLL